MRKLPLHFLSFLILVSLASGATSQQESPSVIEFGGFSPVPYALPIGVTKIRDGQFQITSSSAMSIAAQLLSQKLGVPISFEDAQWTYGPDLMNVTGAPWTILVPRPVTFDFSLPSSDRATAVSAESIIQSVIDNYNASQNPGKFRLIRFGEEEFSIAAQSAKDKDGKDALQSIPLDVRISFPHKDRTILETLSEICTKVSASGSVKLLSGNGADTTSASLAFFNSLNNGHIEIGADDESARDVLEKVFRGKNELFPHVRLSWVVTSNPQTFFDPKSFTLYFYSVRVEATKPDGSLALKDVVWPAAQRNQQ